MLQLKSQTTVPSVEKPILSCQKSEARQVEHLQHADDFHHCEGIVHHQFKGLSCITTRNFCNTWGSKFPENIQTVAQPGLVHLP